MRRPSNRTLARLGLFALLIAVELYLGGAMASTPSIRGYVDTKSFGVSSSTKGQVRKLDVALGQAVIAGQVIAEMDPGSLDEEIAVQMAERKRIVAALRKGGTAGKGSGSGSNGADGGETTPVSTEGLLAIDTRLEQLAFQRDSMRLKSPVDGVVESLDAHPGDAVGPNTVVATVVTPDSRRVIACVPESRLHEVEVGRTTEIKPLIGGRSYTGVVESLTPAIAALPQRCQSPFSRIPEVGRVAVVLLDESADLLPGQTQLVAFGSEQRTIPPTAPVPDQARRAPSFLDVPAALSAVSRFEPSGLVWVSSLDRYVVVSDETGVDRARPWLFTMSRRGVIDPDPLVIEGVSEIDDVESIAAADGGVLWIAASQSVSEKGNRPKPREAVQRLVPSAGGYRVDGSVRLAQLLDAAPDALRTTLGVPDTRALDLEGLAWRGGALYFGVKAPVDGSGRAMIWRVAAPEKLLAGDLAGAGIEVWGSVALTVGIDGRQVPGGIADMMFVDDNSLVITVTASGVSGKHHSGALATVKRVGGVLHATVVETFPDLRPEGIAIGPDPHRIAIVFDRGKQVPMWLERELPTGGEDL